MIRLLVPGRPDQLTGGYLYSQRLARALAEQGERLEITGLQGQFPEADQTAREAMDRALAPAPDKSTVVIDGLALGGVPGVIERHADRLHLLGLVHHPLADETGLDQAAARRLRELEIRALAQVRGVITTSSFTAQRLADYGVPADRVQVVEPGVEAAPLAAGGGPEPQLLCVGSLTPRKGQDLLVEALSRIRELRWTCIMVGSPERDPAYARSLARAIREQGLADRISLVGEKDEADLAVHYHQADLFVLPSWYEGYGMVVSEALARGLPMVTTTGGALARTVPEQAAIKVPPGEVVPLATALHRLLTDPATLARVRRGARAARSQLHRWESAAIRFRRVVEKLEALEPGQ